MGEPGDAVTSPALVEPDWRPNVAERIPPIDKLMARVVVTPGPLTSPCWLCNYRTAINGYSHVQLGGRGSRNISGHRLMYETHRGPVPAGLELDHLCRNRSCINPDHLEPVTTRENFLRGMARGAVTKRTNICQRGHSMEDAYVRPNGYRSCRECRRLTRKY